MHVFLVEDPWILSFALANKEIAAWDSMGLIKRMLDRIEFSQAVVSCGLPQLGSTRCYAPIQLLLQFMLSVWCGANRFEQTEVTRHHPVLKELFDFKRMAKARATAIALIMH